MSAAKNPARLAEYQDDPFLKKYYPRQKRILELAQQRYGMDEDAYLAMWKRVMADDGSASEEDENCFHGIITQVNREFKL